MIVQICCVRRSLASPSHIPSPPKVNSFNIHVFQVLRLTFRDYHEQPTADHNSYNHRFKDNRTNQKRTSIYDAGVADEDG
jgi:hypothetical protein